MTTRDQSQHSETKSQGSNLNEEWSGMDGKKSLINDWRDHWSIREKRDQSLNIIARFLYFVEQSIISRLKESEINRIGLRYQQWPMSWRSILVHQYPVTIIQVLLFSDGWSILTSSYINIKWQEFIGVVFNRISINVVLSRPHLKPVFIITSVLY